MQVGFIGVGAMGAAMAGHVASKGFVVLAHDSLPSALDALPSGVQASSGLAEIAISSDVVIIVVNTDAQTRAVVGGILAAGSKKGQVIVVAATNHPKTMIEMAADCTTQGVGLVDAPVCYGLQGAKQGNLISLCGGSEENIKTVTPALIAYSRSIEHMGPVGTGQIGKACNNMMHWAACVANYETLALAKSCGIDAQAMRETLLKCPARNTTLERWDTTKFTWHEKDLDVALDLSQQAGLALPLFGVVDQLVKQLGPDQVKELLYNETAQYLGQEITGRPISEVCDSG